MAWELTFAWPPSRKKKTKKANGKLITNDEEIIDRWKEYFQELLNNNDNEEEEQENKDTQYNGPHLNIPPPTREEVEQQVKKLQNHKSPGEDEITNELIKNGGEELINNLQELISDIWIKEQMPEEWTHAIIIPIYKKKGNKLECTEVYKSTKS